MFRAACLVLALTSEHLAADAIVDRGARALASATNTSALGAAPSVALHVALILETASKSRIDYLVDLALTFDYCFSELIVTFDQKDKKPGAAVRATRNKEIAELVCGARRVASFTAKLIETRCSKGAYRHRVAFQVIVMDTSTEFVRRVLSRDLGVPAASIDALVSMPYNEKKDSHGPMWKNTLMYFSTIAAARSEYLLHVDEDYMFTAFAKGKHQNPPSHPTKVDSVAFSARPFSHSFMTRALALMADKAQVIAVFPWFCHVPEPDGVVRNDLGDARKYPKDHFHETPEKRAHIHEPYWEPQARSTPWTTEEAFTTQAFLMNLARFRKQLPLPASLAKWREPWRLHIEVMIELLGEHAGQRGRYQHMSKDHAGMCKLARTKTNLR